MCNSCSSIRLVTWLRHDGDNYGWAGYLSPMNDSLITVSLIRLLSSLHLDFHLPKCQTHVQQVIASRLSHGQDGHMLEAVWWRWQAYVRSISSMRWDPGPGLLSLGCPSLVWRGMQPCSIQSPWNSVNKTIKIEKKKNVSVDVMETCIYATLNRGTHKMYSKWPTY